MLFTFFVFDLFWANLVYKIKIITLSSNLMATVIKICQIQCCSL